MKKEFSNQEYAEEEGSVYFSPTNQLKKIWGWGQKK